MSESEIVAGVGPAPEPITAEDLRAADEPMPSSFHVGLDLGKLSDYTALAVVEKWPEEPESRRGRRQEQPVLHLRHLERYPLGTDYRVIAEHVRDLMADPALTVRRRRVNAWRDRVWDEIQYPELVVDATGVGVAVAELIRSPEIHQFTPVTLTGGSQVGRSGGAWTVPKKALISALEATFYRGDLKIAEGLELTGALVDELKSFKREINISGNVQFEPWRESQHDDLILAVALACWGAMRPRSRFTVGSF